EAIEYPTAEHYPTEDHVLRKVYQDLPAYYEPIVAGASRRRGPIFWRYLLEHDGRWLATMQAQWHADRVLRTMLGACDDDGLAWDFVSTGALAQGGPGDGCCEPVLAAVPDGSLLCIRRRGGRLPVGQCRSV